MYKLKVKDGFSAGHQIKGYRGKCEGIHGHNFAVEIEVQGKKLDKLGLLIDFKLLKRYLSDVLDKMDHKLLNKVGPFQKQNPSAENIARYIFQNLSKKLPAGVRLSEVSVWESDQSGATYQP
jgi:6-pyruvoyltetrahydropterin/6-carboxytetrahydropterin synthase